MTFELPATSDLWRTDQLLASGLNSRAIAQLVRGAELVRLRRGTYARAEWWAGLDATARRRQLVFAHALGTLTTSAGGSAYSHTSGAALHSLYLWKVDDRVHLTQKNCPSRISHGRDVVAHTRFLGSRDVCFVDGLPCTSVERRLKIEPPELQYVVRTPSGEHRLDFAWPERKVALEFDGKTKYFDYRPTGDVLFAERRREKALMEQGWTFIRIEWKDLFNEVEFKYRVLRALSRGTAGNSPPFRRFAAD